MRLTCSQMSRPEKRVGVRELRQNLSVYLRRVIKGETYEISVRGKPVALLMPAPEGATPLRWLVSSGRASAPAGDFVRRYPDLPLVHRHIGLVLKAVRLHG